MSEESKENPQESSAAGVDLSSLSDLNFGPNWAGENTGKKGRYQDYEADGPKRGDRRKRGGSGGRDRRSGGRPQRSGGSGNDSRGEASRGDRGHGGSGDRPRYNRRDGGDDRRGSRQRDMAPPFEPTVDLDLYPQDEAFDALVGRLTATARTYQLFEIARLILEKPDRYIVVATNKPKDGASPAPLFFAVPGHLPFETEEAAINHVLTHHLDHFFDIETVELEAPKGNFQVVNRCGLTGELLGPPNYHRYQEFVQRHFNNRIHNMSFERFESKIETVKEQESIDAWTESMKQGERYLLKDRAEDEPEFLSTLEEVRLFLIQHRKDKVVGSSKSVRFAGRDIERMPKGDLRRSVEMYCEQQKRFPLDTANNLRGRLRRHNFTVYKKGSKGVSFVCAVKRKFRDESTVFSDSIQGLITFIDANQEITATKLPKAYLGIDVEKAKPTAPEPAADTVAEASADEAAPVAEEVEATEASAETSEVSETVEARAESVAETVETESAEAPAAEATPVAEETGSRLSDEDKARLNALLKDLRWLVREGYVTEYGDGRLFASAIIPKPKKKEEKKVATPTDTSKAPENAETEVAEASPAEVAVEAAVEEVSVEAPSEPAAEEASVEVVAEESSAVEPEAVLSEPVEEAAEVVEPAESVAEEVVEVSASQDSDELSEESVEAESVVDTSEAEEKPKTEATDEA